MIEVFEAVIDALGRVIYYVTYIPIWLLWNCGGKYIVRGGYNVIARADEHYRIRQSVEDMVEGCDTILEFRCRLLAQTLGA